MTTLSTPIFAHPIGRIGRFRCPADHPAFHDSGPIRSGHLIVFPRTAVCIAFPKREPIIADTNTIMFYNDRQEYRRSPVSTEGDRCEWFAFAPTLIASAIGEYDVGASADATTPFHWHKAPCDPQSYFLQRQIVTEITTAAANDLAVDAIWLEEAMLTLLARVIRQCFHRHATALAHCKPETDRQQALLVRTVQAELAARYTENLTLDRLAATVYLSAYELCRIFRRHTGQTIHHYLMQLRLRRALELLAEPGEDITAIALSLGYSSHSHFTSAFHRTFGITPSALRRQPGQHCARHQLRKNLIV
ncbi:MAG: helix-turn-helix transcriptional regulator [Caldilineaceae bacterium]|nr:helix-turn-helix transcriptional regulator [Caldilineaceae bacterium]